MENPANLAREQALVQERWQAVWDRVRAGRHAVVIGVHTLPPAPRDLQVLRVHCEASGTSGGALDAARRKVEQLLGEELLSPESGREPCETGLRHRFLGDMPRPSIEVRLVEACNRLATWPEGRVVLAFEAIDVADEATVKTLAQMLLRPGWLRLPLLFTMRGAPQGLVMELLYLLCHEEGNAVVIEMAHDGTRTEEEAPGDWSALPPDILRILRAGSVLGSTFEAELVARLLNESLSTVFEKLQWAADAGVPLTDRGEGQFALPRAMQAALQSSILPSLLTFWHTRLGELLSHGQPTREGAGRAGDSEGPSSHTPRAVSRGRTAAPAEATFDLLPGSPEADLHANRPITRYAELFESPEHSMQPGAVPSAQTVEAEALQAPAAGAGEQTVGTRRMAGRSVPPASPPGDPTRAAAHLQAAGRTEAAVAHYLEAVREVAARGDVRRAYGFIDQALTLLNELPNSHRRALLRAQLWLERGRLQWHGALLGAAFTLQEALASLETANSSLPPDAPPEVVEQLATVTAGVCYDHGDLPALQRALAVLTESSRCLFNAGAPILATRLLNDQAAISIRLGDPGRATALLAKSRELFAHCLRQNPQDRTAVEELAATDHLVARLPLHFAMRPGQEEEACAIGLEHARAAEEAYQRLGQRQELARVWETTGRLELQRGHLQAAQERLAAALTLQQQVGDVIGLARSTAALADLCITAGQLGEAVALLTDSITLNLEKGSPIGLTFNRQTCEALATAAAQSHGPGTERLQGALADIEGRLAQAEAVLGRVELPGAHGAQRVTPSKAATRAHAPLMGSSESIQHYGPRGEC